MEMLSRAWTCAGADERGRLRTEVGGRGGGVLARGGAALADAALTTGAPWMARTSHACDEEAGTLLANVGMEAGERRTNVDTGARMLAEAEASTEGGWRSVATGVAGGRRSAS